MDADGEREPEIGLNIEHPFVKELMELMHSAPTSVVYAYFARMERRGVFDVEMENIGGLTKYRRKLVVRALVRMFRAGYRCGLQNGRHQVEEATDGR